MEKLAGARVISILGMHRSGTSALAGALHKVGADFGPESSWLQPAADNPLGFFEYAPVVDLNRDVLVALGGTWSSPPPLPTGWVHDERLADLRGHAEQVSVEVPTRMVVKDPRLSLLQPLWQDVANVQASVLCLRHPSAVASSLLARNQFSVDQSLFLWFRYNAAAALNCPDALVVEYESLLGDPVPQLSRLADHIEIEVSTKTIQAAAGAVHRSMAHHEGADLPDTPIGVVSRRLYDVLRSGQSLETDRELWIWARLITELPWAGPADREISRARAEVSRLKLEMERLTEDKQQLDRRVHRLETDLRHAIEAVDVASISASADLRKS